MKEFNDDVRERAVTARSARHKINGSKSKSCTLPSDNLTPAQRRKMNGECIVYNMDKPVSLDAFRGWPKDLQKQYITNLVERFNVSCFAAAQVFGCSGTHCLEAMGQMGLRNLFKFRSQPSKDDQERLRAWIKGEDDNTPEGSEIPAALPEEAAAAVEASVVDTESNHSLVDLPSPIACIMSKGDFTLTGTGYEIAEAIKYLLKGHRFIATIYIGEVKEDRDAAI